MKLLNLMATAIVVGCGLIASTPSFALCSVPGGGTPGTPAAGDNPTPSDPNTGQPTPSDPNTGQPTPSDPNTGQPSAPVVETPPPPPPPPPPHRIPTAVPTYTPWIASQAPGANEIGSGNSSNCYNNPYNTLAPNAHAPVAKADWCHRKGRSQGNTDACLKAVGGQ